MTEFFVAGVPKSSQHGKMIRLPDGRAFPARRNTDWGDVVGLVARQHARAGAAYLEVLPSPPRGGGSGGGVGHRLT